jgi:hypothetical protein
MEGISQTTGRFYAQTMPDEYSMTSFFTGGFVNDVMQNFQT